MINKPYQKSSINIPSGVGKVIFFKTSSKLISWWSCSDISSYWGCRSLSKLSRFSIGIPNSFCCSCCSCRCWIGCCWRGDSWGGSNLSGRGSCGMNWSNCCDCWLKKCCCCWLKKCCCCCWLKYWGWRLIVCCRRFSHCWATAYKKNK